MGNPHESQLKPTLGLFDATQIGIGAIIGAGIFVVTGIAAGLAGPALIVSMIIAAVVSLFTALSFVELTTWLPKEGGVYEFASRLLSPFAGFLAGWMWVVSYIFVGSAVSLAFSYYFTVLFPAADSKLVAAMICIAFTIINAVGVRHSAAFNNVLVLAKIAILLAFSIVGLFHMKASNFTPFMPSESGVLFGAYFIFFAYSGFARIAVLGEEVKDAKRTVPRSIILALLISTSIYLVVGTVSVGLIGAERLEISRSPLAEAINDVGNPTLTFVVSLGGLLATASVLLTSILGVSRMTFAMARKADLPPVLSKIHQKYGTPYYSILIMGFIMTLLVIFSDLAGTVAVSNFASLFYYAIANVSALRLKVDSRLYPRILPGAGLVMCLILIIFVQPSSFAASVICLAIGAIYYRLLRAQK